MTRWLICVAYAGIVAWGSLMPSPHVSDVDMIIPHLDKIVHFGLYAVFAALVLWSLGRERWGVWSVGIGLGGVFGFGVIMELGQAWLTVSRSFSPWDMGANLIGIVMTAAVLIFVVETRANDR